jgi:hypothetical protein
MLGSLYAADGDISEYLKKDDFERLYEMSREIERMLTNNGCRRKVGKWQRGKETEVVFCLVPLCL